MRSRPLLDLRFGELLKTSVGKTIRDERLKAACAELTSGDTVTDVITWLDDDSSLFELESGDNLISANDDQGGAALVVSIAFNPAVGVLYES